MKFPRMVVIAAFVAIVFASTARAGDTGGSMGGGDFSSSSSHSGGGGGYSHSAGGNGQATATGIGLLIFIGVALYGWFSPTSPTDGDPGRADITVLRVAIDARARKRVQSELARIASVADTSTAEGRATMLREVALMLRRLRDSWIYGGADNEPMMSITDAEISFRGQVDDARSKFKTETVRNEQGAITRADAPELHSTSDDGPGVMLVSVIVAARHELFTVNWLEDGEDLRKALESLSYMVAGELVAVEIVWMPSAEDERISSLALVAAYPPPALIQINGALVGKVFCEFCGSPYPAEAICCPNCGGRAKGIAA